LVPSLPNDLGREGHRARVEQRAQITKPRLSSLNIVQITDIHCEPELIDGNEHWAVPVHRRTHRVNDNVEHLIIM
jgi:hypothetical protein